MFGLKKKKMLTRQKGQQRHAERHIMSYFTGMQHKLSYYTAQLQAWSIDCHMLKSGWHFTVLIIMMLVLIKKLEANSTFSECLSFLTFLRLLFKKPICKIWWLDTCDRVSMWRMNLAAKYRYHPGLMVCAIHDTSFR